MNELSKKLQGWQGQFADLTDERKAIVSGDTTPTPEQNKRYDAIELELKEVQTQIDRLEKEIAEEGEQAKPVVEKTSSGAPRILTKKFDKEDSFQGQTAIKLFIVKTLAQLSLKDGNYVRPEDVAKQMFPRDKNFIEAVARGLPLFQKASVPAASTGNPDYAGVLVGPNYLGDFVSYLYQETLFEKIKGKNKVPPNIPIAGQNATSTASFVGEGKAIPATKPGFDTRTLTTTKLAAFAFMTKELLRENSVNAQEKIANDLRESVSQKLDSVFWSTTAASAGVSPAGILNGVSETSVTFNGSPNTYAHDELGVRQAIQALKQVFISGFHYSDGYNAFQWVMNPGTKCALELLKSSTGDTFSFPEVGDGGKLRDFPIVTGDYVTLGQLALIRGDEIYVTEDMGVETSVSDSVSFEASTVPAGDAGAGSPSAVVAASVNITNAFTQDLLVIKVVRPIYWEKRRSTLCVAYNNDLDQLVL